MSREHVVSRSVLEVAFGTPIRNIGRGEALRKVLSDFEHVLRDVCRACNADLSVYDSAGSVLATEIAESYDATGKEVSFSLDILGWLLKTHLNNIRAARDSATGEKYVIDPAICRALLAHMRVADDRYRLFVEGWAGAEYFWDPEHPRRIPYLSYRTVRDLDFDILISDVRIKWLDTVVLLPRSGNYGDFKLRAQLTAAKVTASLGFKWESVDIDAALENRALRIHDAVETDTLVRSVHQVRGWQTL